MSSAVVPIRVFEEYEEPLRRLYSVRVVVIWRESGFSENPSDPNLGFPKSKNPRLKF